MHGPGGVRRHQPACWHGSAPAELSPAWQGGRRSCRGHRGQETVTTAGGRAGKPPPKWGFNSRWVSDTAKPVLGVPAVGMGLGCAAEIIQRAERCPPVAHSGGALEGQCSPNPDTTGRCTGKWLPVQLCQCVRSAPRAPGEVNHCRNVGLKQLIIVLGNGTVFLF